MVNSLIAYYSHSGNTQTVAEIITDLTNGDEFEIKPVKEYPSDYDGVLAVSKIEKAENTRPEIKEKIENIEDYDIIYLGYPNWLSTVPMIILTFLESYDFTDKTIMPFCTSGGGGLGKSEIAIKKSCPKAYIKKGLLVRRDKITTSTEEIENWIIK